MSQLPLREKIVAVMRATAASVEQMRDNGRTATECVKEWFNGADTILATVQSKGPVTDDEVERSFDAYRKAMDDAHAAAPGEGVRLSVGIRAALEAYRG